MAMTSTRNTPFDAVLLISFGGPQGLDEIRPFLKNVLRGRSLPTARFEEVVQHYELFDGVSPLTDMIYRQADGLRARLANCEQPLPVYVGMRNWHPFLANTLTDMARAGVRRALGLILAAQHSYSSCGQYKQNVVQARDEIRASGIPDVEVTYVAGWHDSEGFIAANASNIRVALRSLPEEQREKARLVFTAHSIPSDMAIESRYESELREGAALVAQSLKREDWALVFQSRSGRPQDAWLEPDVCDYLRAERAAGLDAVVICPIGFVCDHMEVLYDLDTSALQVCEEIGLLMRRAASVNDHPLFLDMLADVVRRTYRRYKRGRPLPLLPFRPPERTEPPPPAK